MAKSKMKFDLKNESNENIRQLGNKKRFHPQDLVTLPKLTKPQKQFLKDFYSQTPLILQNGCAGTGKTYISMYAALSELFQDSSVYQKLIIIRSAVETRKVGFLPGPQKLDSKVLTPNGWTTMGELKKGDYVIAADGTPTEIENVYDFDEHDVYEVETTTGKKTYCTLSHLWETQNYNEYKHNKEGSVKTLEEIKNSLYYKNNKINHYLPRLQPVQFKHEEKKLHPYVLGCLLGDGSLGSSIILSNVDHEIPERINELLKPINAGIIGYDGKINYRIGAIDGRPNKPQGQNKKGRYTNPVKIILDELGLMNKKFNNKFIPESYIYNASIDDRMDLLRGLLDTDGSVHRGNAEFFTSNPNLVNDVTELVRSLGGSCHVNSRMRNEERTLNGNRIKSTCENYTCMIKLPEEVGIPFYLSRKVKQYQISGKDGRKRKVTSDRIKNIEYHSTEPVRCIKIKHPRHLYVTDDFLLTHNTLDEKSLPYEQPYISLSKDMIKLNDPYTHLKSLGYVEFMLSSHLRGLTFDNAIILVDECQNFDSKELLTVLTRVGLNSKIVFCGDSKQDDLFRERIGSGFAYLNKLIQKMDPSYTSIITYNTQDIVRSGLVKEVLLADDKIYNET